LIRWFLQTDFNGLRNLSSSKQKDFVIVSDFVLSRFHFVV
jgi:hypothetical protein